MALRELFVDGGNAKAWLLQVRTYKIHACGEAKPKDV